jgi:hypothetical protein
MFPQSGNAHESLPSRAQGQVDAMTLGAPASIAR